MNVISLNIFQSTSYKWSESTKLINYTLKIENFQNKKFSKRQIIKEQMQYFIIFLSITLINSIAKRLGVK